MNDFWTGLAATWPIWALVAAMVLGWLRAEHIVKNRKGTND